MEFISTYMDIVAIRHVASSRWDDEWPAGEAVAVTRAVVEWLDVLLQETMKKRGEDGQRSGASDGHTAHTND